MHLSSKRLFSKMSRLHPRINHPRLYYYDSWLLASHGCLLRCRAILPASIQAVGRMQMIFFIGHVMVDTQRSRRQASLRSVCGSQLACHGLCNITISTAHCPPPDHFHDSDTLKLLGMYSSGYVGQKKMVEMAASKSFPGWQQHSKPRCSIMCCAL